MFIFRWDFWIYLFKSLNAPLHVLYFDSVIVSIISNSFYIFWLEYTICFNQYIIIIASVYLFRSNHFTAICLYLASIYYIWWSHSYKRQLKSGNLFIYHQKSCCIIQTKHDFSNSLILLEIHNDM